MKKLLTLLFLVASFVTSPLWAQFTGTYYVGAAGTRPSGGDPDYLTLASALTAVNAGTIAGDCTFYITSSLTETANVCLGVNTNGHSITFKPAAGTVDTITFTKTSDNTGASGNWVFGVPNLTTTSTTNYGMLTTDNIIIDGSNSVGGTTRDLVIQNVAAAHANTVVIRLLGEVNNFTLKNAVVKQLSTGASYAVALINRYFSPTLFTPDTVLVENCEINATQLKGQAFAVTNSGSTAYWDGVRNLSIKNNKLLGTARGIFLNYVGGPTVISGNEIKVNQVQSKTSAFGIFLFVVDSASVIDIYNNKISQLQTVLNNTGGYYTAGIECGNNVTLPYTANIYNNFIYGFATSATADTALFYGIRATANAAPTVNLYHNTIYMDNLEPVGSTFTYYGVYMSQGAVTLKNNIIFNNEGDVNSYCMVRTGTAGTLVSNYNDLYPAGTSSKVGLWGTTPVPTLLNWQDSSGHDANSKSVLVNFKSTTDLHLALASDGDLNLIGTPIATVLTDIDGDTRHLTFPYIGADESNTPLPVELTSFTVSAKGNVVELTWQTATEKNSSYFEVQRKSDKDSWTTVGKVSAAGTTTEKAKYSFTEKDVKGAVAYYRLKMVDLDGSYSYSKEVEAKVDLPVNFELSQNYPNPFNPSTTIKYAVPVDSKVKLEIYSSLGELVTTLVNDLQPAGNYSVAFDASRFASGTYIYRLTANSTVITKKMLLLK
ncbi:MAG: T9SS type A sorting domain-containing protein [Ignavibacteria bacterium]|nr:T9SS type A sorting domain-containing protein [Ignavibacteria bacterium]